MGIQFSVLSAAKFISSPPSDTAKAHIPTLQVKDLQTKHILREAITNKDKGALLHKTFFPPANPNLVQPNNDYVYPQPKWTMLTITNDLISRMIDKLKPYKATRKGTVPNSVLINAKQLLVPHIGPLFRATQLINYYPPDWALTKTLVLKKPGKPDYSSRSAWHPIVLSNGLARLLNACMMNIVVLTTKKLHILPDQHFRARPGRTTTDSIHLLVKAVKDAWRKNQVALVLFLDIKGAFPSVDITRLVHNMRKRGYPVEFTDWYTRRLADRQTILTFNNYQTNSFKVGNGLDQGDPFSGSGFLIYNSDLPEIADTKRSKCISMFVDDAAVIVTGKTIAETHKKLQNIMTKTNGILDWAVTHNCKFGINKFQLVDFTKKTTQHPFIKNKQISLPQNSLKIGCHQIPSKDTAYFLGVVLDSKLNWKSQGAATLVKGQDWLSRLRCITKTTKGIHAKYIRWLYISCSSSPTHALCSRHLLHTPNACRKKEQVQQVHPSLHQKNGCYTKTSCPIGNRCTQFCPHGCSQNNGQLTTF